MSKKQSSNRRGAQQLFYTEAFKQKIVKEVLSGKLNKRPASLIYGIKGNAAILYRINQSKGLKGYAAITKPLIHHSDRGVQYCCHVYVKLLQKQNIQISMTQAGDPLGNAVAERIHRTIKEEFTTDRQINFRNIDEAKTEIKKFIEFYNKQRPHQNVQWLTLNQAHQCTGELKRVWKTYRRRQSEWGDLVEAWAPKYIYKNGCPVRQPFCKEYILQPVYSCSPGSPQNLNEVCRNR